MNLSKKISDTIFYCFLACLPISVSASNTVEVSTVGSGHVSGAGSFPKNTTVTLTAFPDTGFEFIGWSGDLAGKENPYSFEVKSPLSVFAHFQEKKKRIVYIDGKPAVADSFVAQLNEEGKNSLRRRVNRVGNTTVYRRMKTYNEFVRIERDSVRRRSKTDAGNNFTAEDLDIISQKNSSLKSISLTMEIKEMLSTNKYEFVEPSWIVRNFSTDWFEMGFQWGLRNIAFGTFPFFGGTIGIDVQAEKAWEIVGQNEGPIVALYTKCNTFISI